MAHPDIAQTANVPLSLQFKFARLGAIGLHQFHGRSYGTPRVAGKPGDTPCLVLNRGKAQLICSHRQREEELAPGGMTLICDHEIAKLHGTDIHQFVFVPVDRELLLPIVSDLGDLAGRPLDMRNPAVRHLASYIDLLVSENGTPYDRPLAEHIGTTLLNLIVLALHGNREVEECARQRGRRATRLKSVVAELSAGFTDPDFSAHHVARTIGVSTRYVQDLLHANGSKFSTRVLELRLQKARKMLMDRHHDRMRISDIALACGFNEISYFNRCYRKRFGTVPRDHRNKSLPPGLDVSRRGFGQRL